jgi:hypothetical protein
MLEDANLSQPSVLLEVFKRKRVLLGQLAKDAIGRMSKEVTDRG